MRVLDRYISITFVRNCLMALAGLVTLFFAQNLMADLFRREFTTDQLIRYHLLSLPLIVVQMTPPAVMLATVFTLSGLSRTNELTACYAIGVGLNRLVGLIIAVVVIVCCATLVLQDRVLPGFYRKRTTYYWREMKKQADFFLDIKQDKIWYRSKNVIYNLQRFDAPTKTIYGMSVYTFDDDFNLVQVVSADRALFTPLGWKLLDGTVTVFTPDDPFPLTKKFTEKELPISETPKDFQEIDKEVDGLRVKELYRYIARMKAAGADTKSYEVKLQSRLSLSFIPIVMCLLAIPFSVRGRREGGVARDLGLCLFFTFLYWLFYSVGLSLGTSGGLPPFLAAWLPSLVFLALAGVLIVRKRA